MTIIGTAIAAETTYATVAQFRQVMSQVPSGETQDALIRTALAAATAMIDSELTFGFAAPGSVATSTDVLQRRASRYLNLPPYVAGSIEHVYALDAKGTSSESTEEILSTEYDVEEDGRLYNDFGWKAGWYRIEAIWGCGLAPQEIVQVCLEKAINLFIGGQGGQFSDVVGVDGGGAVGYNRAWTNSQRSVLANVRLQFGEYGFA